MNRHSPVQLSGGSGWTKREDSNIIICSKKISRPLSRHTLNIKRRHYEQ